MMSLSWSRPAPDGKPSGPVQEALAASAMRLAIALAFDQRDGCISIARPVVHVVGQPVEHDAGDGHVRLLEHRLGAVQGHQVMRARPDDQERGVDDPARAPGSRPGRARPARRGSRGRNGARGPIRNCRSSSVPRISIGIARVSPVGMKSRLGISVWRTVRCQGSSPRSTSTSPWTSAPGLGLDEDLGQAGPAEVDVQEQGPLAGLAQVAARFRAVVLLPSPALALVTSRRHDRPALVGDAQQAGPDVAIGVGLDRIGRRRASRGGRPDASGRSAGSAAPLPAAARSDRADTCSGTFTEWSMCSSRQTRPIPRPKLANRPSTISIGRFGLIGTVGSTTLGGIFTHSLLITWFLRMSNSVELLFHLADLLCFSSRSLSIASIFWWSGIDLLHLGQQLIAALPGRPRARGGTAPGSSRSAAVIAGLRDRLQLFDLVEDVLEVLGDVFGPRVLVEVADALAMSSR